MVSPHGMVQYLLARQSPQIGFRAHSVSSKCHGHLSAFVWGLLLLVTGIFGPTFSARASILLIPPFLLCFLHLLLAYRLWQKKRRMWPVYIATVAIPILWAFVVFPM